MTNENKNEMRKRIKELTFTHDMYKPPKDPSKEKMKCKNFINTNYQ